MPPFPACGAHREIRVHYIWQTTAIPRAGGSFPSPFVSMRGACLRVLFRAQLIARSLDVSSVPKSCFQLQGEALPLTVRCTPCFFAYFSFFYNDDLIFLFFCHLCECVTSRRPRHPAAYSLYVSMLSQPSAETLFITPPHRWVGWQLTTLVVPCRCLHCSFSLPDSSVCTRPVFLSLG